MNPQTFFLRRGRDDLFLLVDPPARARSLKRQYCSATCTSSGHGAMHQDLRGRSIWRRPGGRDRRRDDGVNDNVAAPTLSSDRRSSRHAIRNLLVVLNMAILAIALHGTAGAQANASTFVFNVPFQTAIGNPCTGEAATVVGQIFFENTVTQDSTGGLHSTLHSHIFGRGVGDRGTRYVFVDNTGVISFNNPSSGVVEETITIAFDVVAQGGTQDFKIHITIHTTVDPAGEITSAVLNVVATECP